MLTRSDIGYLIKIRQDLVMNVSFAWFLTENQLIEIKLPFNLSDSKYRSFLNFGNKLQIDLVKTRKHWILRQVELINKPNYARWDYSRYELLAEINRIISDSVHLDQDCRLLDIIDKYITLIDLQSEQLPIKETVHLFKTDILQRLGFGTNELAIK